MNLNEAMRGVLALFPNATIDEDNDGQIIVYTDMQLTTGLGDTLVPFEVQN